MTVQVPSEDFRRINRGGVEIRAWIRGVEADEEAFNQAERVSKLPGVVGVALMPDLHVGMGAVIGGVVATKGVLVPSITGVDIGCGMVAQRLNLAASDLPDNLKALRTAIEAAVPHGRDHDGKASRDIGAWQDPPRPVANLWRSVLSEEHRLITDKYPKLQRANALPHLGTLGTGNHFIEVCLDEQDRVWVMLHSGSRGVGNAIGMHFITAAKQRCDEDGIVLPGDRNLAWLPEGTPEFEDYVRAVEWSQRFAYWNRQLMLTATLDAIQAELAPHVSSPALLAKEKAINCHHNYVAKETHFGESVWLTRKGAVNAEAGRLGIIPGSMGAQSFIVRGKGNPESYNSCSHGAGRRLSRTEARKTYTVQDLITATTGIECRTDEGVLDEIPQAYKNVCSVMEAQASLVEVVHELRQVVNVKG